MLRKVVYSMGGMFVGYVLIDIIQIEMLQTNKVSILASNVFRWIAGSMLLITLGVYGKVVIIKSTRVYKKVNLTLEDGKKIKSTREQFYIGKTSGYVFFYCPDSSKTVIIPSGQISKIEIEE